MQNGILAQKKLTNYYTLDNNLSIQLKGLRFFARHGVHDEEKILGGDFSVNISLAFSPGSKISALEQTIDYVKVYELVKDEMRLPVELLETLAMNIAELLKKNFPIVNFIDIEITKMHPPVRSFTGNVGVRYTRTFK